LDGLLAINAPLFLIVREVIFLPQNCPSLQSEQFGGQKVLAPSKNPLKSPIMCRIFPHTSNRISSCRINKSAKSYVSNNLPRVLCIIKKICQAERGLLSRVFLCLDGLLTINAPLFLSVRELNFSM
jgi:hypothetical protein